MPTTKIAKAQRMIGHACQAATLTRQEFRSLLGSLRHVATCVHPAQAFLQRLRLGERALHRCARVKITSPMRDDLTWWRYILNSPALNGVPLEYFNSLPEPDITVITDASDAGICALVPKSKLALTYQFSVEEQTLVQAFNGGANNHFDINYRELLACAFAVQTWGPAWQRSQPKASPLHIHFRTDNTSAIAWQAKMSSKNQRAQLLIRLLCLWEH